MTRPATVRTADVRRQATGLMRAALDCGMPAGTFVVESVDGIVRLLPVTPGAALTSPDSGEAEWDKALGLQ